MILQHKFVTNIPDQLEDGVLYISIEHCIAIHKCICGCGNEVVTPFSPTDWSLTFNGKTISLNPSIGNWNFECKSHYWITNSKIEIARAWNETGNRKKRNKISDNKFRLIFRLFGL
jgi:hypothetical protein